MRRHVTSIVIGLASLVLSASCTDTIDPDPWQLKVPDTTEAEPAGDARLPPGTGPRCGPRTDTSGGPDAAAGPDAGAGAGINCGCGDSCVEGRCQSGVAEVWKGKYTCNQGITGVTLTVEGSSDNLAAIFKFYAVPENPDLPTGKYKMTGRMDCERNFVLRPDEWIDRPSNRWHMVTLEGTFHPDRDSITGDVVGGTNCEQFEIERADR